MRPACTPSASQDETSPTNYGILHYEKPIAWNLCLGMWVSQTNSITPEQSVRTFNCQRVSLDKGWTKILWRYHDNSTRMRLPKPTDDDHYRPWMESMISSKALVNCSVAAPTAKLNLQRLPMFSGFCVLRSLTVWVPSTTQFLQDINKLIIAIIWPPTPIDDTSSKHARFGWLFSWSQRRFTHQQF